jgi:predicted ATPase/serine phosphatase RsbU (regulator of sigma subunit)
MGPYQVEKVYHKSEKSIVVGALDNNQNRYAIKTINPDFHHAPAAQEKLKYEYDVLSKLDHPAIIKCLGFLNHSGLQGLLLPFQAGKTLAEIIRGGAAVPLEEFLDFALKAVDVLSYLHKLGYVHKDINSNNIFYDSLKKELLLIDFELSTRLMIDETSDFTSDVIEGTLPYISPEQTGRADLPVDYRSDIYSLGVTFFEYLCGQKPFSAKDKIGWIHAHLTLSPPMPRYIRPDIPDDISLIILKMLQKHPRDRYQSIFTVMQDLQQVARRWKNLDKSPFVVAAKDGNVHFELPNQLLGREKETALIEEQYLASIHGRLRVVAMSGHSGVGKSSLARHVKSLCFTHQGLYLEGKFEKYKTDVPYFALKQVLSHLAKHWLTLPEQELQDRISRILQRIGHQLKALEYVSPDITILTEQLPPLPAMGHKELGDCLEFGLVELIQTVASEAPLTLFLDDMQWADQYSINLLEKLALSDQSQKILILLAFRSHEMARNNSLDLVLTRLQDLGIYREVRTEPFDLRQTALYLKATFPNLDNAEGLTKTVFEKTQGNPFFISHFLKKAVRDRAILFDHSAGHWVFQQNALGALHIGENLIDFLLSQLDGTDQDSLAIVKKSAVIGFQFSIRTLCKFTVQTPEELRPALIACYHRSLILPLDELGYTYLKYGHNQLDGGKDIAFRFQHDRIFQASYALVDKEEVKTWHLEYARLMKREYEVQADRATLLTITEHYSQSFDLIHDEAERDWLVTHNSMAAQIYFNTMAYSKAGQLLAVNDRLLGNRLWDYPDITRSGLFIKTKLAFYHGDFELGNGYWNLLLNRSASREEKSELYLLKIQYLVMHGEKEQAITTALEALRLAQIRLSDFPSPLRVIYELARTVPLMIALDADRFKTRYMTAPLDKTLLKILVAIAPAAYSSGRESLYVVALFIATRLTLRKGISEDTPLALSYGGAVAWIVFQLGKTACKFANLADQLSDVLGTEKNLAMVRFMNGAFIYSWFRPWSELSPYVKRGIDSGLKQGEFYYARICTLHYQQWDFEKTVDDDIASCQNRIKFSKSIGESNLDDSSAFLEPILAFHRFCKDPGYNMIDEKFSIHDHIKIMQEKTYQTAEAICYMLLMQKAWMENKVEEAGDWDVRFHKIKESLLGLPWLIDHLIYATVIYADKADKASFRERWRLKAKLFLNLRQAAAWKKANADNFSFVFHLVKAEIFCLNKQWSKSAEHYELAIRASESRHVSRWCALAFERLAKLLQAQGLAHLKDAAILKSHHLYRRWGCHQRAEMLEQLHPGLEFAQHTRASENSPSKEGTTVFLQQGAIDLEAVFIAAQLIASEVVIDRLTHSLLQVAYQYSSSDRIVLILKDVKDGELYLQGEANDQKIEANIKINLDQARQLSKRSIRLATASKSLLIINNVKQEISPADYGGEALPLSLAIIPILQKGELIGLLYLENHALADVYSKVRLRFLSLLSSQMAISLQNSLLFDQMKENIRLENEFAAAKAVQETLIPMDRDYPDFQMASFYKAAESTGGDWFWHYYAEEKRLLYVMIGDVTGHGIPSALVTGVSNGAVQVALDLLSEQDEKPGAILEKIAQSLNRVIFNTGRKANRVMSMAFLCIDFNGMKGYYLNAGHHSIFHVAEDKVKAILAPGSLIGIDHEAQFAHKDFILQNNDGIFLYTDGLIENGGDDRRHRLSARELERLLKSSADASGVVKSIESTLAKLWQGQPIDDDTTFLLIRIHPRQRPQAVSKNA